MDMEPTPTQSSGYALFDTAIGRCAIAWGGSGVLATSFPDTDERRTRTRLLRAVPGAREEIPPPAIAAAIAAITALLAGEADDLRSIPVDIATAPQFDRSVWEEARKVVPGETITYGEIAKRIGAPQEAREVGKALGRNRCPIVVPCHRVVASDGKLGGFSAPGGIATKRRLLEIERRHASRPASLFAPLLSPTA